MKFLMIYLFIFIFIVSCKSQRIQPSPIYTYYITHTDNSQNVTGEKNEVRANNKMQAKNVADIKTQANANDINSEMWKFWLAIATIIFVFRKKIWEFVLRIFK